jgi:hypothetical protein
MIIILVRDEPTFPMNYSFTNPLSTKEWKGEHLVDSFEARRETIIANTEKSERYEKSEYTEDDYQALRCLLHIMRGLMEHEPDKRLSIQEAIRSVSWVDHWREVQQGEQEDSNEE